MAELSRTVDLEKLLRVVRATRPLPDPQAGLLFAANFEGYPRTYHVGAPGETPVLVADTGERTLPHALTEAGLLVRHDRGGDEKWQLSLVSAGGELRRLTHDPQAIHQSVTLHPDRRRAGLGWNPGGRRDVALGEIDLASGELTEWTTPGDFWVWGDWSPDGERAVVLKSFGSRSEAYLLTRTGELTQVLRGTRRIHEPRWTEAGILLVTDSGDRDFLGLALVDPERPEEVASWLFAEDHDLEGFTLDEAQRRAALVVNEGAYDALGVLDLAAGSVTERVSWGSGVVTHDHSGQQSYHLAWSRDGRSLFASWEYPNRPAEIFEWPSGRRWTATSDDADYVGLAEPEELTYPSFDGLPVHCLFYRSSGVAERPVVVNFHGGPEGQSRGEYVPAVHFLNQAGISVLRPNVRGSTGYGYRFQTLDDKKLRWDSVRDGCEAGRYVKSAGLATRIAAMGGSYGGFMTLAVSVEDPELWDAAVDTVGIADWHTFFKNMPPWRGVLRKEEYGDPDGAEAEFLAEISPLRRANEIRAPLLILHGRNDPRVPVTESEQIAERAAQAEIMVFDDEGHGIARLANQVLANRRILDFLVEKLKP